MKMNNNDLIKLTEIKQYFLDPPVSFKLPKYAGEKIDEVISILEKYNLLADEVGQFITGLKVRIENENPTQTELKNALIKTGKMIGDLNNK